jgi:hypothetical protein
LYGYNSSGTPTFAINNDGTPAGSQLNFYSYDTGWFNFMKVDNSGNKYVSFPAGNVGIGTTSPSDKLHVASGNIRLDNYYKLQWAANTDSANIRFESTGDGTGASKLILETTDNANEPIEFRQSGNTRMIIGTNSNVGIGISGNAPAEKLEVNGNIKLSSTDPYINMNGVAIKKIGSTIVISDTM